MELVVNSDNVRLDVYLSNNIEYSRSKVQSLIKNGNVLVNGKVVNASYKVRLNDVLKISYSDDEITSVVPEKMDIDIVYEDEYLAIINKKSGVVVHPAVGNTHNTLANGLMYHFNSVSGDNTIRPGIVHRLDKDTSGLMVVCKDDKTHELLSNMIKNKEVERKYLALVWGIVKHEKGRVEAPIGRDVNDRQKYTVTDINSKDSVTNFKVLERLNGVTLLECTLETGRTHQIRVHMNYIGYPIVNDPVYGRRKVINDFGQMLHSVSIKFVHPITSKVLEFRCEAPVEFNQILDSFR